MIERDLKVNQIRIKIQGNLNIVMKINNLLCYTSIVLSRNLYSFIIKTSRLLLKSLSSNFPTLESNFNVDFVFQYFLEQTDLSRSHH